MQSLRVVHISDLHVGKVFVDYEAPHIEGFAAVSMGAMERLMEIASRSQKALPPPPDEKCCIVSGDLTAFGHGQEFTNAITYLGQGFGRQEIGLYYHRPRAWDGLLGNHDIWGGRTSFAAWYTPASKKTDAVTHSGLTTSVRRGQLDFGSGPQAYIDVDRVRIRFYLLDSTLPGWRNVFARGRVKTDDLAKLKNLLREDVEIDSKKAEPAEYVLRIAVLHHPISRSWNGSLLQSMVLENSQDVLGILEEANFGLVLCGHEHGFAYNGCGGSGHFYELTAGTALQIARPGGTNSFAIIDIVSPKPVVQHPGHSPTITVHFQRMTRNHQLEEAQPQTFSCTRAWNDPIRVVQLMKH